MKLTKTEVRCTCPFCKRISTVLASTAGLVAWERGAMIQNALPELSINDRELLKTGICIKCFPPEPKE